MSFVLCSTFRDSSWVLLGFKCSYKSINKPWYIQSVIISQNYAVDDLDMNDSWKYDYTMDYRTVALYKPYST